MRFAPIIHDTLWEGFRNMSALIRGAGFVVILAVSQSVHAQEQSQAAPATPAVAQTGQPVDNTVHRHLGFFIRPDLGFGYMSVSEPTGTSSGDMTISGAAGLFGVVIGGAVSENIIVAGHIFDAVIVKPNISFSSGGSGSPSDTQLGLFGIGPDFTYYWMPSNVYLTATLALTRVTLTVNGQDSNSEYGIGGRVGLGKEWWVSDHWGLGIAGHLSFSTNKDSGTSNPPTLSSWALGATFSATYN
jgi:hypothetical protein